MKSYNLMRETCTLFVGEGDFSFSANYIVKCRCNHEKVYATCFTDQPLTDRQIRNINVIIENGGFIFTDVDATHLEYHPEIKDLQFLKIVFNFPHIAGKMNIHKNRQLVEQFFLSSKTVLRDDGMVMVTLCQGQGGTDIEKVKRKWSDTWQIVSLAASASFIMCRIQPFNAHEFGSYQCTGFRGLQKPFKTEGALTHIFTLSNPVYLIDDVTKSYLDTKLYLQNVQDLLRKMYFNENHPYYKVTCILNNIVQKIFQSIHEETIWDLLTCMRSPLVHFDIEYIDLNFCKDCVMHLISLFILKKNSYCVTSIQSTICCIKNICINSLPFCHLQAYFSNNMSNLLITLKMFLKYLKKNYTFNTHDSEPQVDSRPFQDIEVLRSHSQSSQNMSVKSILSLYASYSLHHGKEFFFYSDVEFFTVKSGANDEIGSNVFKFGTVLQISEHMNSYFCILFDVNALSCLKYHIMDCRTLLFESSFYSLQDLNGTSVDLYRPFSLYPSTYVHDISFYIDQNFNENDFFLIVRNAVGYLIKSIALIDSYFNDISQKHSRCYRFLYQSCDKVLSKSKADYIHTKFMRNVLENSLNISLR